MNQYPLSNEDINEFLARPIFHPEFNKGLKFIQRAYNSFGRTPYCCYILGESGVGKSKLAEVAYNKIITKVEPNNEATIIPVIAVTLEQGALPDEVRKAVLKKLNVDPTGNGGENLKTLFNKQLNVCEVKCILFDEFHHLLRSRDKDVNRNAANFIKTIVDMKIPVVLFGTPEGQKIFDIHNELNTRFSKAVDLSLMSINTANNKKYFIKFIQQRMDGFPLETVDLTHGDNLLRLFLATGGVLRHLNLLLSEVLSEYRDGTKKLTLEDYQAIDNFTRKDDLYNRKGKIIHPFTSNIAVIKNKLIDLQLIGPVSQ